MLIQLFLVENLKNFKLLFKQISSVTLKNNKSIKQDNKFLSFLSNQEDSIKYVNPKRNKNSETFIKDYFNGIQSLNSFLKSNYNLRPRSLGSSQHRQFSTKMNTMSKHSTEQSNYLENQNPDGKIYMWGEDKERDLKKFKQIGYEVIEDIISFHQNIRDKNVIPNVLPNFLISQISLTKENTEIPVPFEEVSLEAKEKILENTTLWNHPRFLNWYPSLTSFPAILGNLISNSFENPGKSYSMNPSGFELEKIIINWMSKAYNLPDNFQEEKNKDIDEKNIVFIII